CGFPDCEPCCLDGLCFAFTDKCDVDDPVGAFRRLAVFIRLWRTLRHRPGPRLTFAVLAKLAAALHLYDDKSINPDFLRQLAALLPRLADLLRELPPLGHAFPLLALGAPPMPRDWHRAVAVLLDAIEDFAEARHGCRRRGPEFAKVIADNLDRLSVLA